jgi:hypothetical protein
MGRANLTLLSAFASAAGILLVLAAGCGGGGESDTSDSTTPTDTRGADGNGSNSGGGSGGAVADAPGRFFVNSAAGSDTDQGTTSAPFATIGKGIEAAIAVNGGDVYVAGGVYRETVVLASGVNLHGGYNPSDWVFDAETFPSVVEGSRRTITGSGVGGVTVEGFTVRAGSAADPGKSSVAITLVSSTDISIRNNVLESGAGATGTEGEPAPAADAGADGSPGESAAACPPNRDGGAGGTGVLSGGGGGTGGVAGGFDGSDGQSVNAAVRGGGGGKGGATGQDGNAGMDGQNGSSSIEPGAGGPGFGFVAEGVYVPADGLYGRGGKSAGTGGGGGGGGGGALVFACGGGGGGGGGGGSIGNGGGPGGGGGASIGVLLTDGSLASLTGNVVRTGAGGAGGNGADGGAGGAGGKGGAGGARFGAQGAGGRGGHGGKGGDGDPGGGGGGGPSVGIVTDDTSSADQSGNTFELGQAGTGGLTPGGEPGTVGVQAETYTAPYLPEGTPLPED